MSRNGIDFPFPFSIPMFQTSLCIIKSHVSTNIYANTQVKVLLEKWWVVEGKHEQINHQIQWIGRKW